MNNHLLILGLTVLGSSFSSSLNGRSVSRSGELGSVSLVEFNIKGTIYGRCTYRVADEVITIKYEEIDDKIVAKAENPNVADPVAKANECRNVASYPPKLANDFNTENAEMSPEGELELISRLKDYEVANVENQQYVEGLKPKLLGLLSSAFASSFGNYGVSFGTTGSKGGLNIGLPSFTKGTFGATIGSNPFLKWFGKR